MLPDIPKLKKELAAFQNDFISASIMEQMGAFSDCKRHPCFEGDRHGIERSTGDSEVNDFSAISEEVAYKPRENNLGETFAILSEMARKMGET